LQKAKVVVVMMRIKVCVIF